MSHPTPGHRAGMGRAGALALALLVAMALAACGSSSSSSSAGAGAGSSASASSSTSQTHFAKTKFVFHAGLAFGAFHHFIWKPYRAGDFRHPLSHKLTLVKAGLAGGFVYHELKLARQDAQSSPTLSKLISPLTALDNRVHALGSDVRSGNASSLAQDNSSIASIESQSKQSGQPIQEQTPSAGSL